MDPLLVGASVAVPVAGLENVAAVGVGARFLGGGGVIRATVILERGIVESRRMVVRELRTIWALGLGIQRRSMLGFRRLALVHVIGFQQFRVQLLSILAVYCRG